jgi:hypothetical protein
MHKERYQELMLRFAKELHDVGVTENMRKLVEDQCDRAPNAACVKSNDVVRKVYYQYDGYAIEAKCTVDLILKKVKD